MQKNTMVKVRVPKTQDLFAKHILTNEPSPGSQDSTFGCAWRPSFGFGCGRGRHGRLLIDHSFQVVFVDHNTNALKDLGTLITPK